MADATGSVAVPASAGDDARICALLDATGAALEWLRDSAPTGAPAVLRLPADGGVHQRAMRLVARTWDPPSLHGERRKMVCERWHELFALSGGALFIAGYDSTRRHAWGERAFALASAVGCAAPDNPDATCPVCLDTFADGLPTPAPEARAPPGRWACPSANVRLRHAVCRGCDADIQSRQQSKCPICRSDRVVTMHD